MNKQTNYKTGHFAEKIALLFLWCKGYHLVARNYVTGRGTGAAEIDLIMVKRKTLIFVEVKKRTTQTKAAEAITFKTQHRLYRAAEVFLARHPLYQKYNVRFDALLFDTHLLPIHIKDAWRL